MAEGERDAPGAPDGPVHSAEDVRQGEIILRTPARRAIFIAGLVGFVLLAVIMKLAGAY
jgi:hypothetical protein